MQDEEQDFGSHFDLLFPSKVLPDASPEPDDDWQITKGFKAGVDQVQGLGYGLLGLAGDAVGSDTLRDYGIDNYHQQMQEAGEHAGNVQTYKDIHSVNDLADYVLYGTGTLAPTMLAAVAGGGIGGIALKSGAKKAVSSMLGSTVKKKTAELVAKGATREAAEKAVIEGLATTVGATVGAGATTSGMEAGGIFADIYDETGEYVWDKALVSGIAAGSLDALPIMRVFKKLGVGDVAKEGVAQTITKNKILKESLTQALYEGSTEVAQTIIEKAAVKWVDENHDVFTDENRDEMIDAFLLGTIGGGVMGIPGAVGEGVLSRDVARISEDNRPPTAPGGTEQPAPTASDTLNAVDQSGLPLAEDNQPPPIDPEVAEQQASDAAAARGGDVLDQTLAGVQAAAQAEAAMPPPVAPTEPETSENKWQALRAKAGIEPLIEQETNDQRAQVLAERTGLSPVEQAAQLEDTVNRAEGRLGPQPQRRGTKATVQPEERTPVERLGADNRDDLSPVEKAKFLQSKVDARQNEIENTQNADQVAETAEKASQVEQAYQQKEQQDDQARGEQLIPAEPAFQDAAMNRLMERAQAIQAENDTKDTAAQQKALEKGVMNTVPPANNAMAQAFQKASGKEIDTAANQAQTSPANDLPTPTDAQIEAGNYKKGHVDVQGINVAIENPAGSERKGVNDDGTPWKRTVNHHYGYIKRTRGADGDQLDVFIGPNPKSNNVFVVDQVNQKTGEFDEHKVMMGFNSYQQAVSAYKANYEKGWTVGKVTPMKADEFKAWIREQDTKDLPISEQVTAETVSEADVQALADRFKRKTGKKTKVRWSQKNEPVPHGNSVTENIRNLKGEAKQITQEVDEAQAVIKAIAAEASGEKATNGNQYSLESLDRIINRRLFETGNGSKEAMFELPPAIRSLVGGKKIDRKALMAVYKNAVDTVNNSAEKQTKLKDRITKLSDQVDKRMQVQQENTRKKQLEKVQDVVDQVSKVLPGARIKVVSSLEDLPANIKQEVFGSKTLNPEMRQIAFWHEGSNTSYLIADNIGSRKEAFSAILHEAVAHSGVRTLLGDNFDTVMLDIFNSSKNLPLLESIAKDYNLDITTTEGKITAADEFIAHLAEDGNINPSLLNRIIAMVRRVLRGYGVNVQWTDNDIRALLSRSATNLGRRPLGSINITSKVDSESAGKEVTLNEQADVVLRRLDKRLNMLQTLTKCVSS